MSSPPPEDDEGQHFSVSLMVYSKVKSTSAKGKTTSKIEKSTKLKELSFSLNSSNYINFLQAMLLKHSLDNYEVTENKHFPFKYLPPKTKGQRASEAIDVDNKADYKEMVKKITEEKPLTVKIYVDMRSVESLPQGSRSRRSCSEGDSSSGEGLSSKKTKLDERITRWRVKLKKKYKNEGDDGFTYIGPNGTLSLSNAMLRDWSVALDEGLATLNTPPNIASFDVENKAAILHSARKSMAPPATPPASAATDISMLTSAVLLRTLAHLDSSLLQQPGSPSASASHIFPSNAPQTPQRTDKGAAPSSSPPIPSPGQLEHYLTYAEAKLGVRHALSYRAALELNGYGPDVLPLVSDIKLTDLGISAGDVIRLKNGSKAWWNAEGKRKRSDMSASAQVATQETHRSPKRVAYEKRFHDGGGHRFSAPPMQKDDDDDPNDLPVEHDYDLYYRCETFKQWFLVPRGYSVDEDGLDAEDT